MSSSFVRINNLKVFKKANSLLDKNWSTMISASLLAVFSVVSLSLFPLFGFVLSFFASGLISVGYITFSIETYKNKSPKLERVFGGYKQSFSAFALRLIMCVFVFLWSLLLIVPGIISAINYAFALTCMCENSSLSTFDAIKESRKLVKGYRDVIFAIYLLLFFCALLIFGAALSIPLLINYFIIPIQTWAIFTIAGVVSLVVYCIVLLPYFEMCMVVVYFDAKENLKFAKKLAQPKIKKQKTNQTIANA